MDQTSLENIIIAPLTLSAGLMGNVLVYYIISKRLKKISEIDPKFAKDVATHGLQEINNRGWAYRNISVAGLRLSYKGFLEKN